MPTEIESTTIVDLSERAACSTCSWSAAATDAADASATRAAADHIAAFPSHVVSVTRIALTLYRAARD